MKKLLPLVILLSMGITQIYAQCYDCDDATKAFTIGTSTNATNYNSFAGGSSSNANGENSFVFGFNSTVNGLGSIGLGTEVNTQQNRSVAIGSNLTSNALNSLVFGRYLTSTGSNSITMGIGTSSEPLTNAKNNSLMFGVSSLPSLTIVKPSGGADIGYLGIGTEEPKELVHVKAGKLLLESTVQAISSLRFTYNSSIPAPPGEPGFSGIPFYWDTYADAEGLKMTTRTSNGASTQRMAISKTGNVGIGQGITTPLARLHVDENILVEGNIAAQSATIEETLTANVLNIQTLTINNNVGIGTTTPKEKLHVENGNILISKNSTSTTSGSMLFKLNSAEQATWGVEYVGSPTDGYGLNFWSYTDVGTPDKVYQKRDVLFLSDGKQGYVGVGTTAPTEKLDVAGTLKSYGANINGALTANSATITNNANITGTLTANSANITNNAVVSGTLTANSATITNNAKINGILTANELNAQSGAVIGGKIRAKEVEVTLSGSWPDFVFENDYNLRSLSDLEQYIKQNSRLPEIPSAKEIEENGVNLGDMQSKLLQKIEEMTLYILQQDKKITELQNQINELKTK